MCILFLSFQVIGIISGLDYLKHSLGNRLGNLIRSKSIPVHAVHQLPLVFLCTKLAIDFQFHLHVSFVSIDNIDESRPQCLTFDRYFQ